MNAAGLSSQPGVNIFLPLLDSSPPFVLAGFDPRLILHLFLQRPGDESIPSLSYSFSIIRPLSIHILSFWQMEVGEIFLLSSQPLYCHSFRFITLHPALLYSALHLNYVPKSWWLLLARLLYFPANFSVLSSVHSFSVPSSAVLLTSPFSSSFPISSAQMRCCIRRRVCTFLISSPSRLVLGGKK